MRGPELRRKFPQVTISGIFRDAVLLRNTAHRNAARQIVLNTSAVWVVENYVAVAWHFASELLRAESGLWTDPARARRRALSQTHQRGLTLNFPHRPAAPCALGASWISLLTASDAAISLPIALSCSCNST